MMADNPKVLKRKMQIAMTALVKATEYIGELEEKCPCARHEVILSQCHDCDMDYATCWFEYYMLEAQREIKKSLSK